MLSILPDLNSSGIKPGAVQTAFRDVRDESSGEDVPLIRDKGTLILADDGAKARAFIVDMTTEDAERNDRLQVSAVGHGDIPRGEPWRGPAYKEVKVDPLDVYRHAWAYLTGFDEVPDVEVGDAKTPSSEWIGEEPVRKEFTTGEGEDVSFDAGKPYRLNWWTVDDVQAELEKLASDTPFEWLEDVRFNRDDDSPPELLIRVGYPRITGGRPEIKLTVGVNVVEAETPAETDFFSECFVLGAGEGSDKVRGQAARKDHGRMRRTKVISDTGITSRKEAGRIAQAECDRADDEARFVESCRVLAHPAAMPGTYDVGDIITLGGLMPWGRIQQDSRIIGLEHRLSDDSFKLTLARV